MTTPTPEQGDLFWQQSRLTIQERFAIFDRENPHIFKEIVKLCFYLSHRGRKKFGIAPIFEKLRWDHLTSTNGDEPFKLNNDFRSEYGRKVMKEYPQLDGFFAIRELTRKT